VFEVVIFTEEKMNDLVEFQVRRMRKFTDRTIYIVPREDAYVSLVYNPISIKKEMYPLKSGGSLCSIAKNSNSKYFYFLYADSIVLLNPLFLKEMENVAVVTKPYLDLDITVLRQERIMRIKHNPILNDYVLTGHYFFTRDFILKHFPDYGHIEEILKEIVPRCGLKAYRYQGKWLRITSPEELYLLKSIRE